MIVKDTNADCITATSSDQSSKKLEIILGISTLAPVGKSQVIIQTEASSMSRTFGRRCPSRTRINNEISDLIYPLGVL